MKKILKSIIFLGTLILCALPSSCNQDEGGKDSSKYGVSEINNPRENEKVSYYGETVTVTFNAAGAWEAELVLPEEGGSWAVISSKNNNSAAGKGSVRLVFEKNKSQAERVAELYITVAGYDRFLLGTFTQAFTSSSEMSTFLNGKMHERLLKDYLWKDAYNKLNDEGKVELSVDYEDFLFTNLTKLGDVNLEDGGKYRDFSSLKGQRYIYSYIQQVNNTKSPATRATSYGLGIGPTLASNYSSQNDRCLVIGYVYEESPAKKAGLQRGDMIVEVNGVKLSPTNYLDYQYELYYSPAGTYKITYGRFDEKDGTTLRQRETTVTVGSYPYHSIIFSGMFQNQDKSVNIGYLVLESFDLSDQASLETVLKQYKDEGIKNLILDLRFNPGGAVAQCRYLMSSIVGAANYDKVFSKMVFCDGKEEVWSFGYGNAQNPDGLGQGPDLGLKNLHVICSENTGSASEIVINSLRGIDFPVTTYGSRTEGKNVGMVTSQLTYDGMIFEFAPINFYVRNAKDNGDYADGIDVDKVVNNQNSNWQDDIDSFFPYGTADWTLATLGDRSVIWAVQNITKGTDPDFGGASTSSVAYKPLRMDLPIPNVPLKPEMGRFGNIIYGESAE